MLTLKMTPAKLKDLKKDLREDLGEEDLGEDLEGEDFWEDLISPILTDQDKLQTIFTSQILTYIFSHQI